MEIFQTEKASSTTTMIDSFESQTTSWKAGLPPEYADSSARSVALTNQSATDGTQALLLDYAKNDLFKAIYTNERPTNLAGKRYFSLDITNDGTLSHTALAFSTGIDWYWHESPRVPLVEGTNTITFDLAASYYATQSTDWQPASPVAHLEDTRRIAVIVFPVQDGRAILDYLRLSDSPAGKIPDIQATIVTPAFIQYKPASYLKLSQVSAPAQVNQRFELSIETDGIYTNPFDPAEVDLRVSFTSPDGDTVTVPAFWYQDYHQMGLAPTGEPGWRVRFTPTQPGIWTAKAILAGTDQVSEVFSFNTAARDEKAQGFIRQHPFNARYFATEDEAGLRTFFPIGINLGWGSGEPLSGYSHWMQQLAANGGNITRIWMASWSFGIEWNDTGLGDYSKRLDRAWKLDKVFEMAEQHGIYIELVLLNHGAFSTKVNPQWDENPYNLANGGMCADPACFVTDPQAIELNKRRLRYTVARWGYSPALFAWEWWNEANWTPIQDDQMVGWIRQMTPVILENDPNQHLISTSYAHPTRPKINNLPVIDFAQSHLYSQRDPALEFPSIFQQWQADVPGKPVLFAEFGNNTGGENSDSPDQQGLHLHNSLWASTFSGFASTAMYWWWDSYVDPLNLWSVYQRLSYFIEGEDLALLQPGKFHLSDNNFPILVLQNEQHALAWIHDRKNAVGYLEQALLAQKAAGKAIDQDWIYRPEPVEGLTLTVLGLEDGEYTANWYLPTEGSWIGEDLLRIENGEGSLPVPTFQGDIAFKIK